MDDAATIPPEMKAAIEAARNTPTKKWFSDPSSRLSAQMRLAAQIPDYVTVTAPEPPPVNVTSSTKVEWESSNPKKQFGSLKPSLSFIPPVALLELAAVMELGATKYGPHNWVSSPVDFTTYYDAAMRHLMLAMSGEDVDPESKALHVAHAMACCAILVDAIRLGNLIDNRPKTGDVGQAIWRLTKKG